MEVTVHNSIDAIPRDSWNRLCGTHLPFLRHEFLASGETSGSVSVDHGWIPQHLTLHDGQELRAAMPLYEKHHSWGEFVFDWAWANAYEQTGLAYYPKLVSCSPFTPATGARMLLRDADDSEAADALLTAALTFAEEGDYSSLHIQFPDAASERVCKAHGLLLRKDCQFHWRNEDFADFEQFLGKFTARKRKKVNRERRRIREAGITFRHLAGNDMTDALWAEVHDLISQTFMARGALPYYNRNFFERCAATLPENIVVILAEHNDRAVAAAVCFVSSTTLYGRYWGSNGYFDSLHFETCYYQGIDYCIEHGLQVFEPGTQGEHKVSRGFTPVTTASAHWLAHPEFSDAIARYLSTESRHVDQYMASVEEHTPFRRPQSD